MKIPFVYPRHIWKEMPLPPLGNKTPYQCECCGLLGHRSADGAFMHILSAGGNKNKALHCTDDASLLTQTYARITTHRLEDKGGVFAHLREGSVHRVIPQAPIGEGTDEHTWIVGPHGPVEVLPEDVIPAQVRRRRRSSAPGA